MTKSCPNGARIWKRRIYHQSWLSAFIGVKTRRSAYTSTRRSLMLDASPHMKNLFWNKSGRGLSRASTSHCQRSEQLLPAGGELSLALGFRHPQFFGMVFSCSPGAGYKPDGSLPDLRPAVCLVAGDGKPFFLENAQRWGWCATWYRRWKCCHGWARGGVWWQVLEGGVSGHIGLAWTTIVICYDFIKLNMRLVWRGVGLPIWEFLQWVISARVKFIIKYIKATIKYIKTIRMHIKTDW